MTIEGNSVAHKRDLGGTTHRYCQAELEIRWGDVAMKWQRQ